MFDFGVFTKEIEFPRGILIGIFTLELRQEHRGHTD
jgi:hypothetical protein